jgi:hypothetical protein
MKSAPLFALAVLLGLAVSGAAAQTSAVEVTTWDGQVLTVTDPSFEVLFTSVPPPREGAQLPSAEKQQAPASGRMNVVASVDSLRPLVGERAPVPVDGRRRASTLAFSRGGVETRVAIERIASLTLVRVPVENSPLPPHVAPFHVRYRAAVVLRDGTRIDADSVNFGALVLRGLVPQGTIDLPWERIAAIRFGI